MKQIHQLYHHWPHHRRYHTITFLSLNPQSRLCRLAQLMTTYLPSNNCAICLDAYVSGDTIVTSCNPLCPHAFHQECIIEWLVKMQEGTPCPCCRRTFVELSPSRPTTTTANVAIPRQTTSPEQEERRRVELQRTIELGIRRGRAFDISVISLR